MRHRLNLVIPALLVICATAPTSTFAQTPAVHQRATTTNRFDSQPSHLVPTGVDPNAILGYDTDLCAATREFGLVSAFDHNNVVAYDTLKYFIEHCYDDPIAWQVFGDITDCYYLAPGEDGFLEYRQWLRKVLYLSRDTSYYCADVFSMIPTITRYFDTVRGFDEKGVLAIEKYIVASGKCPELVSTFTADIPTRWKNDIEEWRDTVKDSLLTPYDSTLPTLKEIGFEILLGPEYAAVHDGVVPTSVLGRFAAAPNPFDDKVHLTLNLQVPATLTLDVFDALGRRVQQLVPGVFTMNGMQQYTFGDATLPSGTYYVRASVPEGEVETLRIVKH